jgi:hypothetical protein
MFMKTVTMPVPLCEKHKWHWVWPPLVAILGLVAIFGILFAGIAAADALKLSPPIVFIPVGVLALAWLVAIIVLSNKTIRPTEITDKSITLKGVSEDFVEAMKEARRGDDDDRPRRGRSRFDDDDDEDRPRRKRARDDEEERRPRAKRRTSDDDDSGGYYDPEAKRRRAGASDDED